MNKIIDFAFAEVPFIFTKHEVLGKGNEKSQTSKVKSQAAVRHKPLPHILYLYHFAGVKRVVMGRNNRTFCYICNMVLT